MVSDIKRDISKFDTVRTSLKLEQLTTKILKWKFQQTWTYWVVGQKYQIISGILDAISPHYIRKSPRSVYARVPHMMTQFVLKIEKLSHIIGARESRDHKRAPFLVLGLPPWYGTIFLFLEKNAPSPAGHARTCCKDFCGCRAGEMASEIPKFFMFLAHNSTRLSLLEFCLSIFVLSCSSLSKVRQCRI